MSAVATQTKSVHRVRKEAMAEAFRSDCEGSEAIFVADYSGLDVPSLGELRQKARDAGGRVRVVKNSVARRVVGEKPDFAPLAESLKGQLIYGSGPSATDVAKTLKDFAADHEELELIAGVMGGTLIDKDGVKRIAALPPRDQMIAILAGTLGAPIAALARSLSEVPSSLARVISAVRDAKND